MSDRPSVLILGATSDIAQAVAKTFAERSHDLILAARNPERLQPLASDLRIRYGVKVELKDFNAEDSKAHDAWVKAIPEIPEITVLAFGYLPDQIQAQKDWAEAARTIQVNYTGAVSILEAIAVRYEERKSGSIIGISSVAGERGRQSNYLYGSAKAGLTAYLSGLRNRLQPAGVHVITVKPGFVNTKMLAGKETSPMLTASPEALAKAIYKGWRRRKSVLYHKTIWRWIMWVIRSVPESIFKKMKL